MMDSNPSLCSMKYPVSCICVQHDFMHFLNQFQLRNKRAWLQKLVTNMSGSHELFSEFHLSVFSLCPHDVSRWLLPLSVSPGECWSHRPSLSVSWWKSALKICWTVQSANSRCSSETNSSSAKRTQSSGTCWGRSSTRCVINTHTHTHTLLQKTSFTLAYIQLSKTWTGTMTCWDFFNFPAA